MTVIPTERSTVLLVSEALRPGALTRYAATLLQGLPKAALSPRLLAPEGPPPGLLGPTEAGEVALVPGLLGSWLRPFALPRAVRIAKKLRPSLVHGLSAFTAPTCQKLAQALGVPYVLSVHHYQGRGGLLIGPGCAKVLATSEALRENLVNDARVPKELIRVVRVGIVLPEETPADLPEGRLPLVATIAPLAPSQDLPTFLRAAKIVREELTRAGEACQFLIVGDGPEEPALRRLSHELGLEKDLVFTAAGVPPDKVLPEAAVYVQSARKEGEGAGGTVLEAMAWGRPVIASSVGGLIGIVRDGETGFLCPSGDPPAMADRILRCLRDPALRRKLGQAGREVAVHHFSLTSMIERTVDTYAEALGLIELPPSGLFPRLELNK